jgi:tRNA-specific 2-thiouridylase
MPAATPQKVVLGMSGGVDSSVAAKLLKDQGYEVLGVTLKVWEEEDEISVSKRWQERGCCKVGIAKHVAELLDISHQVIDTRESFQQGVIDDFIGGYLQGTTPNPCVRCNERVKFGGLFQVAEQQGADYIATGHYATIQQNEAGTSFLARGRDTKKDQSYFLYRIPEKWLSKMLFPLGAMEKPQVWEEAEAMGLPVEELKESQEICFVTQGDYREFLKEHAPQERKGLGIATGNRLYVQRVVPDLNLVVLGPPEELDTKTCRVADLNIISPESLIEGQLLDVKFRYGSPPVPARLHWDGANSISVTFETPVRALSPGQSAVFYEGDRVLGGGIIQTPKTTKPTTANIRSSSLQPLSS